MKKLSVLVMIFGMIGMSFSVNENDKKMVLISTSYGDMKLELSNETPGHRDNFIKLVSENYYNGTLFHRVMKDFMIQGGDPNSATAAPGTRLGTGGPGYTIPAEIDHSFIHRKGALCAARQPDAVNPEFASSGSQFYIVEGKVMDASTVLSMEERRNSLLPEDKQWSYTTEQLNAYVTEGGVPQLDGSYTVFGQLTEGFEVLKTISEVPVDRFNRPIVDIPMDVMIIK